MTDEEDSEAYEQKLGGIGAMNAKPPHPAIRITPSPLRPKASWWQRFIAACYGAVWGWRSGWRAGEWLDG